MVEETRDTKKIWLWKESLETGLICLGLGGTLALNGYAFIVLIFTIWNKWLSWELSK